MPDGESSVLIATGPFTAPPIPFPSGDPSSWREIFSLHALRAKGPPPGRFPSGGRLREFYSIQLPGILRFLEQNKLSRTLFARACTGFFTG